jgi:hypothetical protein
MIHNCIVVEEPDGTMRTVHGGTPTHPAALVEPERLRGDDGPRRWLWTTDAFALDSWDVRPDQRRLAVWYQEFQATKPDGLEVSQPVRRWLHWRCRQTLTPNSPPAAEHTTATLVLQQ